MFPAILKKNYSFSETHCRHIWQWGKGFRK